ncbi:MAG: hypothetical protein JW864_14915 [Spirochaetes bacterium]|nr:hypothetical protein [Spirochaetota bacterium]
MTNFAEKAVAEERYMNAAFFYRAAEIYTYGEFIDKEVLYDMFIENFYKAFKEDIIAKVNIPYKSGFLPALKLSAQGEKQ